MAGHGGQEGSTGHGQHSSLKYTIGYMSSLVLTAIAFYLALTHSMNMGPLVVILTILGGFQIVVQLYFFMHVTEGDGPPFHSVFLLLGLLFTFAIGLMSVWIMGFPAFMARVS